MAMEMNRGVVKNVVTRCYVFDKFAKRLGNINKDSYTMLGFHVYIVSFPYINGHMIDLPDIKNHLDLINPGNRIYHTDSDFYNFNMKCEQYLLNIPIKDTSEVFTNATHMIFAYETISVNEPLRVDEYGLQFSKDPITGAPRFGDTTILNENNIAFVIDWYKYDGSSDPISLFRQINKDETLRVSIDLHQYRFNTNLLSIHLKNKDGLNHSHGLATLYNSMAYPDEASKHELKFDSTFTKWTGMTPITQIDNVNAMTTFGLSPLVMIEDTNILDEHLLTDEDIKESEPTRKIQEIMYEDWNDSINSRYGVLN